MYSFDGKIMELKCPLDLVPTDCSLSPNIKTWLLPKQLLMYFEEAPYMSTNKIKSDRQANEVVSSQTVGLSK